MRLTPRYSALPLSKSARFRGTLGANQTVPRQREVLYLFECFCGLKYIGECESLFARIRDHQQPSKGTAVFNHTSCCEEFAARFAESHDKNNFESRFNFLKTRFQVLHSFLNYHDRTQVEALEICLRQPILNRQVKHRKLSIM